MRTIRCRSCGERFYASTPEALASGVCQNCTETHDPVPQLKADAEAIKKTRVSPKSAKPQSVDPRNPGKTAEKDS